MSGRVVLLCHGVEKSKGERNSKKSVWVRSALSTCESCSGPQRVSGCYLKERRAGGSEVVW